MSIRPLYECHGHIMMDGMDFVRAAGKHKQGVDVAAVRENLAIFAETGVVYFRDGGDSLGVSAYAKKIANEYGIHYATPAFALYKEGRYGNIVGRAYSSFTESLKLIKQAKEAGADYIKLVMSGLMTFDAYGEMSCPPLSAEEIFELVKACHGEGFRVMAHVNGRDTIKAALEAGTDSIEHGYFMDEECIDLLIEKESVWVPTLAPLVAASELPGKRGEIAREILMNQRHAVSKAIFKGAHVASGSDSGCGGVLHGIGILTEYEMLRKLSGLEDEEFFDLVDIANVRIKENFRVT